MKLAMISFKKFINDYDKKMHVDSVRINEYFKNLKSIFMTDFYYIDGNNLIGEDKIINLLDINFFSNYDLIFFYHESTIEKIINSIGLEKCVAIAELLADTEKNWSLGANLEVVFLANVFKLMKVL